MSTGKSYEFPITTITADCALTRAASLRASAVLHRGDAVTTTSIPSTSAPIMRDQCAVTRLVSMHNNLSSAMPYSRADSKPARGTSTSANHEPSDTARATSAHASDDAPTPVH